VATFDLYTEWVGIRRQPPTPFLIFIRIKMARTNPVEKEKDRVLYRALTDMQSVYLYPMTRGHAKDILEGRFGPEQYPKDLVMRIKREAMKFEPGPIPRLLGCYEVLDQEELIKDRIQETLLEYCQRYIYSSNKE
jgi:hypothetical protein